MKRTLEIQTGKEGNLLLYGERGEDECGSRKRKEHLSEPMTGCLTREGNHIHLHGCKGLL